MKFRTYKRRDTTRKSGFHTSGETTGSECKIVKAWFFQDKNKTALLKFCKKKLKLVDIFGLKKAMLALGFYIFPESKISLEIKFKYLYQNKEHSINFNKELDYNKWNKIGVHDYIDILKDDEIENIFIEITFFGEKEISYHIYGLDFDIVTQPHYIDNENALNEFNKKTAITVPETYYLNHEQDMALNLVSPSINAFKAGKFLVIKSCNRCSRYLPINIDEERTTLAYSNHCASRAPCSHKNFAKYKIMNESYPKIEQINEDNKVQTYYGHQLECKACKKFFVNAPLNPIRTSTQHREDSLRRRAIEVLVDTLLDNEWIYHKFRKQEKKEFDKHIWETFEKKCFNCGKSITVNEMDLDHTMPLAYLWPLDIHATCLCSSCNSKKSDLFPVEFYDKDHLIQLSKITKLPIEILSSKIINMDAVEKLVSKVDWFFDVFLMHKDYQKIRDGKKTADQIYHSIQKVIIASGLKIDLLKEYHLKTNKYPKSITLKHD